MKIVNRRYEIKNKLKSAIGLSEYEVIDIKTEEKLKLSILNEDIINESIKRYLMNNFLAMKNMNFDGVTSVYEVLGIREIDGIEIEKRQYAVLGEMGVNEVSIREFLSVVDEEKYLKALMELIINVNTLNLKGFVYTHLSLDDIKVNCERGEGKVKLPNILISEFSKVENLLARIERLETFQEAGILNDKKSNLVDVIKIINEAIRICEKNDCEEIQAIKRFMESGDLKRTKNINQLIEYINSRIKGKYPKFLINSINNIETKIDLIGRDIEQENVMNLYESIFTNKINSSVVMINGGTGVGKTKLLKTIKSKLEYKYDAAIVSMVTKENETSLSFNDSVKNYSYDKNFENDSKKFLSEFSKKIKKEYRIISLTEVKEIYKIINSGLKIIDEHSRIRAMVIIIDDLERKNNITKMFLKQLLESISTIENLFVLVSVNSNIEDDDFKRYYSEILVNPYVKEYKMEMFNKYYTEQMVSKMLNSRNTVSEIVDVVYKETLGNPKLISSKIKELHKIGSIYISNRTGIWNYKSVKMLYSSNSYLEEKYIDKIESLTFFEYTVLKKLAIYNFAIREDIFLEKVIVSQKEKEAYMSLRAVKVITESYDDNGINIDFKDYFYKKVIYKRLNKGTKKKEHVKFVSILKEACEKNSVFYEELIYHLEMSGDIRAMSNYTRSYANMMIQKSEDFKAINAYKRLMKNINDYEKMEIAYDIGDIYSKLEANLEALRYYKISNEKSIISENYKYVIETSLNIARLNIENENYVEAFENINIAKINLLKTEYKLGYAKYFLVKSIHLRYMGNREEGTEFICRALNLSEKEGYKSLIGECYLLLFKDLILDKDYERAEEIVTYCEKTFTEGVSGRKYYETLINRAVLIMERDKNMDEAYKILIWILKVSEQKKMVSIRYNALMHLGNLKWYLNELSECKELLLECVEIVKVNKSLNRYLVQTYNFLFYIAVVKRDIGEIIKYKNKLIERANVNNQNLVYAVYYYCLGDFKNFRNKMGKVNLEKVESRNQYSMYFNIEYKILEIPMLKTKEEVIEKITETDSKLKTYNNPRYYGNTMMRVAILLSNLSNVSYVDMAENMFMNLEKALSLEAVDEKLYLRLKNTFTNSIEVDTVKKTMQVIDKIEESIDKIELYYLLGNSYEAGKFYILALENYYEGLIMLTKYVKSEIQEDRRKILTSNMFIRLFNRFMICANDRLGLGLKIKYRIGTETEIENFLFEIKVSKLLQNETFKEIIMNRYEKNYKNNFRNMDMVLETFNEDVSQNIEALMKFLIRKTMATSAVLILNSGDKNEIIYTYRLDEPEILKKMLGKKVSVNSFIVNYEDMEQNEIYEGLLPENAKSFLYKKIKREYGDSYKNIDGEIILMADKLINNINEDVYKEINKYENALLFLLDQYRVTVSSTRDKLTGAYNRGYFEKTMDSIVRSSSYVDDMFSVIIFDIDNFKSINDKFGHQVGDVVLEDISRIVKENLDNKDIFCRYGGEEFVIICPKANEQEAYKKAEKFRESIEKADILRGRREVTVSLGVASYPNHSKKKNDLIKKADQALYEAKRSKKNIVKIWNESFDIQVESTDKLAGIITGTQSKDYERISSLIELVEIIKSEMDRKFKIYKILSKIIKLTGSKEGILLKAEDGEVACEMAITEGEKGWKTMKKFNKALMDKVLKTKKGIYTIDWDDVSKDINVIPKWNSICIVPLIRNNTITGVIYLSVPMKRKEFDFKDYNYVNTLGNILSILY